MGRGGDGWFVAVDEVADTGACLEGGGIYVYVEDSIRLLWWQSLFTLLLKSLKRWFVGDVGSANFPLDAGGGCFQPEAAVSICLSKV